MLPVLWPVVLGLAFLACRWSARLFDDHYADRAELGAVGLVALSILGPTLLGAGTATLFGLPVRFLLAVVVGGGLLISRQVRRAPQW